jgi:hypothetical protein
VAGTSDIVRMSRIAANKMPSCGMEK